MTPTQLVQHFGTQAKAARAIGVSRKSVNDWVREGKIPDLRQYQIQAVTSGALAVDSEILTAARYRAA